MQRPQRTRKAPVPLYVPDANVVMEDDFDEAGDGSSSDEGDDGGSIVSGSDVSYSGSEANEYEFDDFLVPDHESTGQASEASDEDSDDEDSDDEMADAAESEQTVVIDLTGTNEE